MKEKNKKNLIVVLLIFFFLIINNSNYIAGFVKDYKDPQIIYSGASLITNYTDHFVYLSNIEQGKNNKLFIKNLYNHESEKNLLFSPHWYLVGQFSNLTNINTIFSYQIFRILLSILFILTLWLWLKKIFKKYKERVLSLLFILFSTGVGQLYLYMFNKINDPIDTGPNNVWIPESITFLTLNSNPLFILSQTLILLVFFYFIKALEEKNKKFIFLASFLAFILVSIHPYDLFIITPVLIIFSTLKYIRYKEIFIIKSLALYFLAVFIPSLYYLTILKIDKPLAQWAQQNITLSPNISAYLIGFGGLFILSSLTVYCLIKKKKILNYTLNNNYLLLLTIWGVISWFLVYLPIDFNRRLSNGWHVPLAILSFLFLLFLFKEYKDKIIKNGLIPVFLFILFFDTLLVTAKNIIITNSDVFYIKSEEMSIYKKIKETVKDDEVVLARWRNGLFLPAFTGKKTYLGHGMQTWNYIEKDQEIINLWASNEDISSWLEDKKIKYIFADKKSYSINNLRWLANENYIIPIINNDDFIFYEFRK